MRNLICVVCNEILSFSEIFDLIRSFSTFTTNQITDVTTHFTETKNKNKYEHHNHVHHKHRHHNHKHHERCYSFQYQFENICTQVVLILLIYIFMYEITNNLEILINMNEKFNLCSL